MRVRTTALFPDEEYPRMFNMTLPEITRFIAESRYRDDILSLTGSFQGLDLIEAGLSRNLARSFQDILRITPGFFKVLTTMYLNKWDIKNVMLIFRGREHKIPAERILRMIIPAGEFNLEFLTRMMNSGSTDSMLELIRDWVLFPVVTGMYKDRFKKNFFSRLENELYRQYYTDILKDTRNGIRGGDLFSRYIRFEIDITNIKNLFRLRSGGVTGDVGHTMIQGGFIPPEEFIKLYGIEEHDLFIHEILNTRVMTLVLSALRDVRNDPGVTEADAATMLWKRWQEKKRPSHEMEMAVTRVRLRRLESISKRHPFSVLPLLLYLEKKKYEVNNLRAIARGKEFNVPADTIRKYIVV
jgi:V/A-type H+-transporting ATPase subunit C